MKRHFCVLFALSMPLMASATDALPDLPSITQALSLGKSVSVVINLSLCAPASADTKPSETRGGKRIDAYMLMPDGTLAFSDDHFTLNLAGKPFKEFVRYRIHPNGTANFSISVLSVPSYQPVGKTRGYNCAVGKGLSFFAAD